MPKSDPILPDLQKNGHLATSNVCPKKTEIGKLLRERARKHAKPNQESRRKKGAPQPPPPPPPLNPIQPPPMLERTYAELVRGTPAFDRDSYEVRFTRLEKQLSALSQQLTVIAFKIGR